MAQTRCLWGSTINGLICWSVYWSLLASGYIVLRRISALVAETGNGSGDNRKRIREIIFFLFVHKNESKL